MKPDSPKMIAAAATRLVLLRTAHALFTEHGYEVVTLRTIAKAADKSIGALFTHWPSKDHLFREAVGRPPLNDAEGFAALTALAACEGARPVADRIMATASRRIGEMPCATPPGA